MSSSLSSILMIIYHYLRRTDLTQCVWMVVSIQNRESTPGMNIASGAFAIVTITHMNCLLFHMFYCRIMIKTHFDLI